MDRWQRNAGKDATDRAGELWRAALERYEQPPFDDGLREELEAFVAHGRAEIEAQG